MDYLQTRWVDGQTNSAPTRVKYHSEPEDRGFYHDDDGEPFEYWIEGNKELNFES